MVFSNWMMVFFTWAGGNCFFVMFFHLSTPLESHVVLLEILFTACSVFPLSCFLVKIYIFIHFVPEKYEKLLETVSFKQIYKKVFYHCFHWPNSHSWNGFSSSEMFFSYLYWLSTWHSRTWFLKTEKVMKMAWFGMLHSVIVFFFSIVQYLTWKALLTRWTVSYVFVWLSWH